MSKKRIIREWIWIDLEMTGLDPKKDKIIEISTLVTNENLDIIDSGPELVIKASDSVIESMDEWNQKHHARSGLIEKVKESKITIKQAEKLTLEFIQKHAGEKECILCGSSVYHDKNFLYHQMRNLHDFFHFRIIDVASIIELAKRWYPNLPPYKYNANHRALDDIKESIEALR
ncbi:MAG: oligoribonuclease, partial [Candidatus Dojkabacteria bacterium]|nr:oligoribonuclease [Candidatus Dojkabacteria bacterium]